MTAGVGRPGPRAEGPYQQPPAYPAGGGKRLQTSHAARGAHAAGSLAKPAATLSAYGHPAGPGHGQDDFNQRRQHYQSQNQGSLTMAGMNIKGKSTGFAGNRNPSLKQAGGNLINKQSSLGHIPQPTQAATLAAQQVQPMSFNINFNTTNINMK